MVDAIPLIDLSSRDDNGIAEAIGHAARTVGFFSVTGHGLDPELLDAVFLEAHRFFALPLAEKTRLSISRSPHNRGYVAMKAESLDPSRAADLKEAFNIGLDLTADDPRVLASEPFRGVNLWPDLAGWRETMLDYFDAVWRLGRRIHGAIALDLGLPASFFEDKLDQPMATLRLLHYPPQPAAVEPGQIGAGAHTDYGGVTLLLTNSVGGLEVRRRDGAWIAALPIPGAFICNIGDCMMRWTNDVYVSTPHRVVNRSGRERHSVAFFLDPNPDVEIACLPACVSDARPARYPPVRAATYLRGRLDATYGPPSAGPS